MKTKTAIFILFSLILCGHAWSQAGVSIESIVVKGNRTTHRSLVLNTITLKENDVLAAPKLQESVRNLNKLGLFSKILVDQGVLPSGRVVLTFVVEEFPVLDHYEIIGAKKVDEEDIEKEIHLHEGQVLTDLDVKETVDHIKSVYEEEGFLLAQIEAKRIPSKDTNKVVLEFDIKEGKRVKVAKVTITGCEKILEKKIKGKMDTKEDRWWRSGDYKEDDFDKDLETIEEFYKEKGYLDARVTDYQLSPYPYKKKRVWGRDSLGQVSRVWRKDTLSEEASRGNLHVEVQVHEGIRYHAGIFTFEGNTLFKEPILAKEVKLDEGDIFNQKKFEFTKWKLQSLYLEEGYIYCRFDEKRTYRGDTVDLHFKITEGMPAYINRVLVEGNIKTQERVIRREITLFPGNIYRQSRLERSIRNVMHLNYFTDVKHDIRPMDDGNVNIVFRVAEREDIGQVSMGVGYSARDGVVGTASLSIPNFRGTGQKLDISMERGAAKQNYSFGFSEPWLFDTPTSAGLSLFYRETPYYGSEISLDRGGEVRLGRKLRWPDDYFSVLGAYQLSKEGILGSPASDTTEVRDGRVVLKSGIRSSLSLRLIRDDTDMPQFANSGSVLYYNPQFFGGLLGGNFDFIKHVFQFNWYVPTFWKFVLGVKARAAYIDGTKVSRYHLLRAGGVNYDGMIRGYNEGLFGGVLSDGLSMLVYSAAFRFPIVERQLYLSLFADAGNTFGDINTVDPTDLKRSAGVGIRFAIPMLGILGFDVAHGFDPQYEGSDEVSGLRTHFQIGKEF